jgi:mono/diheme cytochrome c family protein
MLRFFVCLVAATGVLGLAGAAPAAGPAEEAGRTFYRRYCAACHGHDGRGDGPVAPALGEKPTDLTAIAREHDGTFPFVDVVASIDGTRTLRAHGVSEMPVWGEVLAGDPSWSVERHAEARGKIILITEYLRSIQRR